MKPILVAENISKKYTKKADQHLNYGVRDFFAELLGRSGNLEMREDEFLAVENASFCLYPGDTLALIGRNGCGKTTTLRMLNGTLKPDSGSIQINGRVQALISLGTGFDQKLPGLENIYNAAAVLGLNSRETRSIVDEVVDFSELEDFIDSPVGTYSSGMTARLGFSVAVHLNPEILLIDEILGVGDHMLQNKCAAKMQQMKKDGVTMILVPHSEGKIIQLCEQSLWMHKGKTMKIGNSADVVASYLSFLDKLAVSKLPQDNASIDQEKPIETSKGLLYGAIFDDTDNVEDLNVDFVVNGSKCQAFPTHSTVTIEYDFLSKTTTNNLTVTLVFYKKEDGFHYGKISTSNGTLLKHIRSGRVHCKVTIDDFNINPGTYVMVMVICEGHSFLYRNVVQEFVVENDGNLKWGIMDFSYHYEVLTNTPA
ncbi:hypothetical protein BVX94_00770 [bacterium B17]|nr:hypothetical protein BVX94_00770 [bacterium B17]